MKSKSLFGAWKLKSLETRASDGSVSYPWRKETLGYVAISPEGYFCVAIMNAGGIQERNYKIEGKTLSVSNAPTLVNGREQVGYLIFERA